MIIKLIEFLRIAGASFGIYWSYSAGMAAAPSPESVLHLLSPWLLVSIAGTSGIEGLLFAKEAAAQKGFEQGSNYQKQSAIALLSYAVMSVAVYCANWGTNAEATIVLAFMFFMILSATNHAYEAITHKNYKWANINRPFLTMMLIAAVWYPIIGSIFK